MRRKNVIYRTLPNIERLHFTPIDYKFT